MKVWIGKHFVKCTKNITGCLCEFGGGNDWKLMVAVIMEVLVVLVVVVMMLRVLMVEMTGDGWCWC